MPGCIAHARNGRISTSGLKSHVTIVFLDPDFLKGAKMSANSRTVKADYVIFAFSWPLCQNAIFDGQNRGRDGAILTSNELVFPFGGFYVCVNFVENRSRNAIVRVPTDGHTYWHTDRRKPIS